MEGRNDVEECARRTERTEKKGRKMEGRGEVEKEGHRKQERCKRVGRAKRNTLNGASHAPPSGQRGGEGRWPVHMPRGPAKLSPRGCGGTLRAGRVGGRGGMTGGEGGIAKNSKSFHKLQE